MHERPNYRKMYGSALLAGVGMTLMAHVLAPSLGWGLPILLGSSEAFRSLFHDLNRASINILTDYLFADDESPGAKGEES